MKERQHVVYIDSHQNSILNIKRAGVNIFNPGSDALLRTGMVKPFSVKTTCDNSFYDILILFNKDPVASGGVKH